MKDPELIYRITRSVKENISIPVTVKIRSGVDEKHINAVECALAAESAGASLVTVHGRTRTMLYSGVADREIIKNVKDSLHIPVVANGDVTDVETALAMLGETGADGIMIGRGAVGNPYLFAQIRAALEGKMFCVPTLEEKRKTALLQLRLAIEDKGETVAVNEARKQIAIYFKGFRGSATLRAKINAATTYAEVEAALEEVK